MYLWFYDWMEDYQSIYSLWDYQSTPICMLLCHVLTSLPRCPFVTMPLFVQATYIVLWLFLSAQVTFCSRTKWSNFWSTIEWEIQKCKKWSKDRILNPLSSKSCRHEVRVTRSCSWYWTHGYIPLVPWVATLVFYFLLLKTTKFGCVWN